MLDFAAVHRTGNRYADQYIVSAERLGLDAEIIDASSATALIRGNGRRISVRAAVLGCNNVIAARMASNKFVCSTLLREGGFRVPDFAQFSTFDHFDESSLARSVLEFAGPRFPVVLKPVRGEGGLHVYSGIAGEADLDWALGEYFTHSLGDFLVEKHIDGRHYRVKLFDGKVINALERHPARITGDGRATVRVLIDELNETRTARELSRITPRPRMMRLLWQAGLDLDSVLAAGRTQPLSLECNAMIGGTTRRLAIGDIPATLVSYLADAAGCCGLRWVGVDYIADDLMDPGSHRHGFINEMNSAPTPSEYYPERTLDEYLEQATRVLREYFLV